MVVPCALESVQYTCTKRYMPQQQRNQTSKSIIDKLYNLHQKVYIKVTKQTQSDEDR